MPPAVVQYLNHVIFWKSLDPQPHKKRLLGLRRQPHRLVVVRAELEGRKQAFVDSSPPRFYFTH
ncbi:hypothetical protein KSP40_PGU005280 [Platanthera guangdongensis]|uniref:Uncharacterized protein n=1 Tax=Platanthera guangdongensis TaxID=2320717 RepID=A0ABR2LFQ1_9ASPA